MIEHEYFDWNHLIDLESRNRMVSDIRKLIEDGHYWKNSPKFQTDVNVFGLNSADWVNLKMSFIWSCFAYLQREVQIKSIKSWSYMTSLKHPEPRENLWHTHDRGSDVKTLSAVYYLHLPPGVDTLTAGTEFAPLGPEKDGHYFAEARVGQWIVWPGKSWHRPGILQSQEDRFIVAADLEF